MTRKCCNGYKIKVNICTKVFHTIFRGKWKNGDNRENKIQINVDKANRKSHVFAPKSML